jgi:hypothetical protein
MLPNDLLGYRVGEPAEDDGAHSSPHRVIRESVTGLDVVGEGVSRQGHQHEITPKGLVRGCGVQDDVHQLANVRNRRSLDV